MYYTKAQKYESGHFLEVEDALTVEEMLSIAVNGNPYTMTMRSPGFEEELTRGILLSEDVYGGDMNPQFEITETNEYNYVTKVNVTIPEHLLGKGIATQRNLLSVTSCGMCGKYEADLELVGEKIQSTFSISPEALFLMFEKMSTVQSNFKHTGGSHASAIFDVKGNMLDCKEDIGRHNAVDKVIGSVLMQHKLQQAACILVSGRVSYEIVSKCYRAGIPNLAAVSAPSSMAVDYCKDKGIHLFAFCRKDKLTQYS